MLDGTANPSALITSMFMHGGWFHILGNMWFLWVFGDNVEDAMGPFRFVVFYILCGLAAAFAQIAQTPPAPVPMVGAAGAIGGVMDAYALLYPRAHVHTFVFLGFYATAIAVPAVFMLGYWFLVQLVSGLPRSDKAAAWLSGRISAVSAPGWFLFCSSGVQSTSPLTAHRVSDACRDIGGCEARQHLYVHRLKLVPYALRAAFAESSRRDTFPAISEPPVAWDT